MILFVQFASIFAIAFGLGISIGLHMAPNHNKDDALRNMITKAGHKGSLPEFVAIGDKAEIVEKDEFWNGYDDPNSKCIGCRYANRALFPTP